MGGVSGHKTVGQVAMDAALAALSDGNPTSTAIVIFIAAARHLGETLNDPGKAGELAYWMADELATGGR